MERRRRRGRRQGGRRGEGKKIREEGTERERRGKEGPGSKPVDKSIPGRLLLPEPPWVAASKKASRSIHRPGLRVFQVMLPGNQRAALRSGGGGGGSAELRKSTGARLQARHGAPGGEGKKGSARYLLPLMRAPALWTPSRSPLPALLICSAGGPTVQPPQGSRLWLEDVASARVAPRADGQDQTSIIPSTTTSPPHQAPHGIVWGTAKAAALSCCDLQQPCGSAENHI